ARLHRFGLVLEDILARPGGRVIRLDQQPVVALFTGAGFQPDQMPAPMQLVALELEIDMAFLHAFGRIAFRNPLAVIPDDDRAAAILALRNGALEGRIVDRVRSEEHTSEL